MSARFDQTLAVPDASDPLVAEALLNGEARNYKDKASLRGAVEARLQQMKSTRGQIDGAREAFLKQPELFQRYNNSTEDVQRAVDGMRFDSAKRNYLENLQSSQDALETVDVEGVKKGMLAKAWEKVKSVLKLPAKHPFITLFLAYLAAPSVLTYVAGTEFAATRPEVLRAIEYLQSFLAFGRGGTGVKPGGIADPLS